MNRAILFAKDGTLIDFQRTWGPATHTVLSYFAEGDQAAFERLASVSGFIATESCFLPASPLIAGATSAYGRLWAKVLGRAATPEFFAAIDRQFEAAGLAHLTPIGDPQAVLARLRQSGYRVGIVTNDAEANARSQAARLDIDEFVEFIAGYDSGFGAKPDAGPVLAFARAVEAAAQDVVMVGDSIDDLVAARAAGAFAIGVLSGPARRRQLEPYADALIETIDDLPGWLDCL